MATSQELLDSLNDLILTVQNAGGIVRSNSGGRDTQIVSLADLYKIRSDLQQEVNISECEVMIATFGRIVGGALMKLTLFDRFLANVAPGWEAKRLYSKIQREVFRTWDLSNAIAMDREAKGSLGPLEEIQQSRLAHLKVARSQDRRNSWAHGIANSITNNIVGNGITLQSRIRMANGKLKRPQNLKVEEVFGQWATDTEFPEVQRLIVRERWVAGEVLAVRRILKKSSLEVPLKVDLVESERLADLDEELPGGGRIVQGVEYDADQEVVAYHLHLDDPNDPIGFTSNKPERVPAEDVIHVFRPIRPGHVRGITKFACAAPSLEALSRYLDFELTRAQVSSAFALLWKRARAGGKPGLPKTGDSTDEKDDSGNPLANITGGMILQGGPGDALESAGASIQSTAFDPFVTLILRGVAVGLGVSYEVLARDFSKTNFSSARQSNLEDRRHWEPEQQFLINRFNSRVLRWFIDAAALRGIRPFDKLERIPVFWQPPGWNWVDPTKEVAADKEAIRAGLMTPQQVAARAGHDFYENLDELAEAKVASEERGLKLDIFEPKKAAPDLEEDDDEDEDGEEKKKKAA